MTLFPCCSCSIIGVHASVHEGYWCQRSSIGDDASVFPFVPQHCCSCSSIGVDAVVLLILLYLF